MKTISCVALLSIMFPLSNLMASENKLLCSFYYVVKYEKEVRKLENDKQMHCGMSCMVARQCGSLESTAIGYIKEFVDLFTNGTPDREDLKANKKGIKYARRASSNQQCINYCRSIYPKS